MANNFFTESKKTSIIKKTYKNSVEDNTNKASTPFNIKTDSNAPKTANLNRLTVKPSEVTDKDVNKSKKQQLNINKDTKDCEDISAVDEIPQNKTTLPDKSKDKQKGDYSRIKPKTDVTVAKRLIFNSLNLKPSQVANGVVKKNNEQRLNINKGIDDNKNIMIVEKLPKDKNLPHTNMNQQKIEHTRSKPKTDVTVARRMILSHLNVKPTVPLDRKSTKDNILKPIKNWQKEPLSKNNDTLQPNITKNKAKSGLNSTSKYIENDSKKPNMPTLDIIKPKSSENTEITKKS